MDLDTHWEFEVETTLRERDQEYLRLNPPPMKRHRREKTVVCKHWMKALCKKGDNVALAYGKQSVQASLTTHALYQLTTK